MFQVNVDDRNHFIVMEVHRLVRGEIIRVIGDRRYEAENIDTWKAKILENCLTVLNSLRKRFIYDLHCYIVEKAGSTESYYRNRRPWDKWTVLWENDTVSCIVIVRGLPI